MGEKKKEKEKKIWEGYSKNVLLEYIWTLFPL